MNFLPRFPSLKPKIAQSCWFAVDQPTNEDKELKAQEQEHLDFMKNLTMKHLDIQPIGKPKAETVEDDDDDDEEDDNDDEEESETPNEDEEDELEIIDTFEVNSSS